VETHLSAVEHHRAVVAVLTVVTGRLPGEHLVGLAETTGPVLVFVIAMTIVTELASVAGVFSIVAERLAVWGRGRRALLWVFVLAMVTVSTAFMSLDTTAVLITVLALTLIHRRSLVGRYELTETTAIPDRRLLLIAAVVVAVLLPLLVTGIPVALVAGVAALVLLAVFAVRRRSVLTLRLVPWRTIGIAASLFVIVEAIHVQGYDAVLGAGLGQGEGVFDLLRIAVIGALGANAVNNLPAYLSLSAFADTPLRLGALLIGVNLAPVITPWGSLATLLWHQRLTAMGVEISWRRFALLGLGLALVLVPVTTLALWLG